MDGAAVEGGAGGVEDGVGQQPQAADFNQDHGGKYLNNIIERDHRRVKQRIYPMPGFKQFRNAAVTISGIELAQKIRKGQFDTSRVAIGTRVPVTHIREMVIAA